MKQIGLIFSLFALILGCTVMLPISPASANLTITPTLVVIEGRQRFADVNLVNTSNKVRTYEISWEFKKMVQGAGNYTNVNVSTTDFDLTKNLVFTPKRVTLEPNQMQKVRLALRYTGEPPSPGDYRAHLKFQNVGETITEEERQAIRATTEPGRNVVGVGVRVGFSIPVVLRIGEPSDQISIGSVVTRINEQTSKLEAIVPILKTKSAYGTQGILQLYHQGPEGEKMVGEIRNANIFAEIDQRIFEVVLTTNDLSTGSLRIVYKDANLKEKQVYAEKIIPISR